jgi:hypothetical protein
LNYVTIGAFIAAAVVGVLFLCVSLYRYSKGLGFKAGDAAFSIIGMVLVLGSTWQGFKFEAGFWKIEIERIKVELEKKEVERDQGASVVQLNSALERIAKLEGLLKEAGKSPPPIGGSPPPVSEPPVIEEAKANIRWVIQLDAGARATYTRGLSAGLSPYDAVLAAERHNQRAMNSVIAFGKDRTEAYIKSLQQ